MYVYTCAYILMSISQSNCNEYIQHTQQFLSIQYCASPFSTVPVHSALCQSIQHCANPFSTVPVHSVLCQSIQHCANPFSTVPVHSALCQSIQHCASPFSTVPVHSVLCQSIQHCASPFSTVPVDLSLSNIAFAGLRLSIFYYDVFCSFIVGAHLYSCFICTYVQYMHECLIQHIPITVYVQYMCTH